MMNNGIISESEFQTYKKRCNSETLVDDSILHMAYVNDSLVPTKSFFKRITKLIIDKL